MDPASTWHPPGIRLASAGHPPGIRGEGFLIPIRNPVNHAGCGCFGPRRPDLARLTGSGWVGRDRSGGSGLAGWEETRAAGAERVGGKSVAAAQSTRR